MPIVTGQPTGAPGPGPQPGGGVNIPVMPPPSGPRIPSPAPSVPGVGGGGGVRVEQTSTTGVGQGVRAAGEAIEQIGRTVQLEREKEEAKQVAIQQGALDEVRELVTRRHAGMASAMARVSIENIAMAKEGLPYDPVAARSRVVEAGADYYASARVREASYREFLERSGADMSHPTVKRNLADYAEQIARGEQAQGAQARVDVARKEAARVVVPFEGEQAIEAAGMRRGFDPEGRFYDEILPQTHTALTSMLNGVKSATNEYDQQRVVMKAQLAVNKDIGNVRQMKEASAARLSMLGPPEGPRAKTRILTGGAELLIARPEYADPSAVDRIFELGRPGGTKEEKEAYRRSVKANVGQPRSNDLIANEAQWFFRRELQRNLDATNANKDEAAEMLAGAMHMLPQHNRPGSEFSGYDKSRRVFSPGHSLHLSDASNTVGLSIEANMDELGEMFNDAGKGLLRAIPEIATGVSQYAARPMQETEGRIALLTEVVEFLGTGVLAPGLREEYLGATGALKAMERLQSGEIGQELRTMQGFEGPPSPGGQEILPTIYRKSGGDDVRAFEDVKRWILGDIGHPPAPLESVFAPHQPARTSPPGLWQHEEEGGGG